MEKPPKAEKCGPFIELVLDELNCNLDLHDKEKIENEDDLRKFPGHHGGLYIFYMKPDGESDLRYPVYVGVTKQSFKERFQRHATHGVIHEVWNGKFPIGLDGLGLYAYCTHYHGDVAKRIKSILLETFDFALKNGRSTIDISESYPAEWTKRNLEFPWDELKKIADGEDEEEEKRKKNKIPSEKGGHFIERHCDLTDQSSTEIAIRTVDQDPLRSTRTMINTPSNKTANISGLGVDVISWNVNDMTDRILGKKSDCNEFINNLLASQIFLLQETKGGVKIPGYTCYNKLRSSSRSGGLCIGIRREISHLVKNLNTTGYDDIMAVRISGKLIEEKRDIILVNVYDSPENSSYKIKQIKSGTYRPTMDSLREFLANIQDGTPYLVAGDFNARTGERCEPEQHIGEDLFDALCDGTYFTSSHNTDLQRSSQDPKINERGRVLLDLTREANLKILNGSTIGDVLGKFTCLRYNGNSVIDYMLVENSIQTSISHFEVLDFTDFSDHRPIKCRIRRSSNLDQIKITERFTELPPRYQWDQVSSPVSYQGVQNDPSLNAQYEAIRNAACSTPEDVEKLNKDLTKAISDTAELSLQIKKKVTKKRHGRKPAKNKWFDSECIKSRIELRKASKKYCSNPLNELIRRAYYLKRKDYRHLIKRKKVAFYRELNIEIEENHNIKWESLKKLQRARSEQNNDLDIYDHVAFYKFLLDELNCNIDMYDQEQIKDPDDVNKFPAHYGGLYLFYMKPNPTSDFRYPIYVGVAKKSFRERFQRQANDNFTGIRGKIWSGEFKFEGHGVYAVCTHHQGPAAQAIKKLLLDSFHFPLKRNRRGQLRRELDTSEQLPAEYVKDNYDIQWKECLEKVAAAGQ
ncbi:hypothetical protein ACHWQZ_G005375 [Mnemiopsis leidyi]